MSLRLSHVIISLKSHNLKCSYASPTVLLFQNPIVLNFAMLSCVLISPQPLTLTMQSVSMLTFVSNAPPNEFAKKKISENVILFSSSMATSNGHNLETKMLLFGLNSICRNKNFCFQICTRLIEWADN